MNRSEQFVSVVLPFRDPPPDLTDRAAAVVAVLREHFRHYELILVDDGSDVPPTDLDTLARQTPGVRLVRLSRRFGPDAARTAGLDSAIGDLVVLLGPDDPPEAIPEVARLARDGVDVVRAIDRTRPGALYRGCRAAFRWVCLRVFGWRLPSATVTLVGLSRRAVNALTRVRPRRRQLTLWIEQIGYPRADLPYDRIPGGSRWPGLARAIDCGLDLLLSSSRSPLRVVSYVGLSAAALNLLAAAYVVGVNLVKSHVAEGWTTLAAQNSLMFFLVFLTLVLLAEYVGRNLEEAKGRPLYHVLEEVGGSLVAAEAGTRNVVTEEGRADAA